MVVLCLFLLGCLLFVTLVGRFVVSFAGLVCLDCGLDVLVVLIVVLIIFDGCLMVVCCLIALLINSFAVIVYGLFVCMMDVFV